MRFDNSKSFQMSITSERKFQNNDRLIYIYNNNIVSTQAVMHLYVYLKQHIATELLPFDNKNAEYRAVHLKYSATIECNI